MAKTLTFTLTDDQETALEQYIELPQFNQLAFSPETKQNEPVRQFADIESYLQARFAGLMDGVIKACPPPAIQARLDAIKLLESEIAETTKVKNVISKVTKS